MIYLQQILSENSERGRLDCAALDIARLHYPDLDPQPTLDQLNQLASSLGDRIRNFNDGREFVEKAQQFLFEELGFRGNAENFYDPLNSCLNQVLERRVGIPITLSVMYMEIARRLHMPVYGIGLPGHFLLQFDDGRFSTYIDPFNRGVPLTARDCYTLANAPVPDPALLRRVTKKQIAMRMLQNLHRVYVDQRDFERAFTVLDLLLSAAPENAAWYRARGALHIERKRYQAAKKDFEKYLDMEPDALDRPDIEKQLGAIRSWLAVVN